MITLSIFVVAMLVAASYTEASSGGSYYAPPCPEGRIRWVDGSCFAPVINRRFFTYQSPQHKRPKTNVKVFQNPNRNFNYVFVRAPEVRFREQVVVSPPKEQSLIYLLSQGNQVVPREVIQLPAQNERPEVYYVNYNDPNEDLELPGGVNLQTALAQQTHTGQFISSGGGSYGADTSLFARIDQIQEIQGPQAVEISLSDDDKTIAGVGASGESSIDQYRQPAEDSQVTSSVIQEVTYFNTESAKSSEKDGSASASASSSADAASSSADAASSSADSSGSSASSSSDDGSSSSSAFSDASSGSDDYDDDEDGSSGSSASSSASASNNAEESSSSASSSAQASASSSGGDDGASTATSSSSSSALGLSAGVTSKELTGGAAESSASESSGAGSSSSSSASASATAVSSDSSGTASTAASDGAGSANEGAAISLGSSASTASASSLASSTSIGDTGSVIDIAASVLGSNTLEVVQVEPLASAGSVGATEAVITVDPVAEFISSIGGDDSTGDDPSAGTQTIAQNIASLGKSVSSASLAVSSSASEKEGRGKSLSSGGEGRALADVSEPVAFQSGPALGADVKVKHFPKIVSKI